MGQNQPLIGLLCAHEQEKRDQYYVTTANIQAIVQAGGIPVLIPYQPKEQVFRILEGLDGIMLPGGIDVDPNRYGEQPIVQCGSIDPHWDELDLWAAGFALSGICQSCHLPGCQVLNVALGGTLIQDIPAQPKGRSSIGRKRQGGTQLHDVSVQSASLSGVSGERIPNVSTPIITRLLKVGNGLRLQPRPPTASLKRWKAPSIALSWGCSGTRN